MLAARQFPASRPATDRGNLFGFERYDGGAVVLHALRREIGDDAFFELLQRWVADNDGTSRTTDDFTALAERSPAGPRRLLRRPGCTPPPSRAVPRLSGRFSRLGCIVAASATVAESRRQPAARQRASRPVAGLGGVGAGGGRRAEVDAEPAQRLGLPPRRAVADPRQAVEVGVATGDQVGERRPARLVVDTPSPT